MQAICDKILIIAHGKLVAFDDADNLEQSLTGSAELRFTTDAAPDRVREILSGVDGLGEIRLESQPDGTVSGQCPCCPGKISGRYPGQFSLPLREPGKPFWN